MIISSVMFIAKWPRLPRICFFFFRLFGVINWRIVQWKPQISDLIWDFRVSAHCWCAAAAAERAVLSNPSGWHHVSFPPGKSDTPLQALFLPFLPPCTPRFLPPSVSPPASALCGRSCRYGTDTSAGTQRYFKNCCLCCLLTIRAGSVSLCSKYKWV